MGMIQAQLTSHARRNVVIHDMTELSSGSLRTMSDFATPINESAKICKPTVYIKAR